MSLPSNAQPTQSGISPVKVAADAVVVAFVADFSKQEREPLEPLRLVAVRHDPDLAEMAPGSAPAWPLRRDVRVARNGVS